ncbi:Glucosamine-phosphate N-acetyltransferase-like protein [Basidiobolus ranarum]|uniref:Glucosamine-phosphate N-acetyltransferase-like protein n=1 Tax=Basidiobolus ranarum TaxID=34480 RepID=A0ABR2WGQ2_9FUNG
MPITNIDQQPFADSAKTKIARSIGATQPLFSEALITESILSELPAGYIIRPLITADFERGFIDCLAQLTDVGEMDRTRFIQTFTRMQLSGDYYVIVIEELETSKVVGCGTLLREL